MKSFNIIDVKVQSGDHFIVLDIINGIIINRETDEKPWLLEVTTRPDLEELFEKYLHQDVNLLVTITRPENEPAQFSGKLEQLNAIHEAISLIFLGDIKVRNPNYSKDVLEKLVKEGYSGEQLLAEFDAMMDSRKDLK